MKDPLRRRRWPVSDTLHPQAASLLTQLEFVAILAGLAALIVRHGLHQVTRLLHLELGLIVVLAMTFLTASVWQRHRWSRARATFARNNRGSIALSFVWAAGLVAILLFHPVLERTWPALTSRPETLLLWTETLLVLRGIAGGLAFVRSVTASVTNPALLLVVSFLVLIGVGTLLLMLPRARAQDGPPGTIQRAPAMTALFTATSAACVTGLQVEPTHTYWSRFGQTVILGLIQLGGLGIMTFGAFVAAFAYRGTQVRETATMGQLLESEGPGEVRRLVLSILAFTFGAEAIGAVLLSGLWSDRPLPEQLYNSVFHSVSAFCNAGFSLTDDSFVGMSRRWQVWGVVPGLIITGGLGFAVLHNMLLAVRSRFGRTVRRPLFRRPRERVRLELTTRLVLIATASLLAGGAVTYFVFETVGEFRDEPLSKRIADAWFQSVTFRTAGFNTVDHAAQQPSTKLLGILLMFVGASPGSMGGGIRTVCFSLAILGALSILRGRDRVEAMGRTIPLLQINRALTVITLAMAVVLCSTLLLVLFEETMVVSSRSDAPAVAEQPPKAFIDLLYEAVSAFATVGVSAGVTPQLTTPSRMVIVGTMFLGRVGPLTMLLALTGRVAESRYEYPEERVALG